MRRGKTGEPTENIFRFYAEKRDPAGTYNRNCMYVGGRRCNVISFNDLHEEVVLLGMNNEVGSADSAQEFVHSVNTGVEKIQEVALHHSLTTVVLPPVPTATPEAIARVH